MQVFDFEPRNFAGRFILLFFAFLMLVLTAIYTGNTGKPQGSAGWSTCFAQRGLGRARCRGASHPLQLP